MVGVRKLKVIKVESLVIGQISKWFENDLAKLSYHK